MSRLQVLYAARELGAKEVDSLDGAAEVFEFSALKVPDLYLPIDNDLFVIWKNSKLIANTRAEELGILRE